MNSLLLGSTKKPYPTIPTREQVCGIHMSFTGGIIVDSPTYGKMPWWPSALSWCDPTTRQLAYAGMRVAGDTHALIEIPNGLPLYDETGQFYSPDKFGPLDWTNGETQLDSRFTNLVDEVIQEGFKILIAMDERQPNSTRIVQLVMKALTDRQSQYCVTMPGYDGVFYGWPNDQVTIPTWASLARAIKPNCYLGLEFQPGRPPLGNGTRDYEPGGLMDGFDVVLSECRTISMQPYNRVIPSNPPQPTNYYGNQIWQPVARMVSPYYRPADQPANSDSSNPPFYPIDSPRGPRYFCYFETDNPYDWVRTDMNNPNAVNGILATINSDRQYAKAMGCKYIG